MLWKCRNHSFDLSQKTHIMGIVNVTPDSFSDGGKAFDGATACDRGLRLADEGAHSIDIGGESTRPGADEVSLDEELSRVIPVISSIRKKSDIALSIDTRKAEVARQALEAGVDIVNDISGLTADEDMADVIAEYKAGCVLMHLRGVPKTMQDDIVYADVVQDIYDHLAVCLEQARSAGIARDAIALDPGIGFGKTTEHNLAIIRHVDHFVALDRPVLVGVSRKSFIGNVLQADVHEREWGTAASIAVAIRNGARIVRVHDVGTMAQVARMVDALINPLYTV